MNLSRKNLTETKLEILVLEYLNNKPFLRELLKETKGLLFPKKYGVIINRTSESHYTVYPCYIQGKWNYHIMLSFGFKNDITKKLFEKNCDNSRGNNRYVTNSEYIWY